MTVNDSTRKLVRERAKYLCEYCHSLEEASAALFASDHIRLLLQTAISIINPPISTSNPEKRAAPIKIGAALFFSLEPVWWKVSTIELNLRP